MTVKSGAPLITLIASIIAICINAVKCIIPAAVVCAFSCFICEVDVSIKGYCITLIVMALIISAVPSKKSNSVVVNLP
jgi:hypothetical protein